MRHPTCSGSGVRRVVTAVDDAFTLFDDAYQNHASHPLTSNDDTNDAMTRFLGNQPKHARMRTRSGHTPNRPNASSSPPATPHWVTALEARTGGTARLTSGGAIPAPCTTCGRWTLQGYDAPRCAGHAITDPHPLTPALEAACVILAVPTWQLWGSPDRYELTPRHEPGVPPIGTARPAGDVVVLAAHHCGRPPLAPDPIPVTRPRTAATLDAPPF
jgi:hypothetical protein